MTGTPPDAVLRLMRKDSVARKLRRNCGRVIARYALIEPEDRILVSLSGGKDSWVMLVLLSYLRYRSAFDFDVFPVHVAPGIATYDAEELRRRSPLWLPEIHIERTDMRGVVVENGEAGKSPCAFCAVLRRGILARVAGEHGCNKIALGHQADDVIETALLGMLYRGKLGRMAPRTWLSRRQLTVIRPMCTCWERDIARLAERLDLPVIDRTCPFPVHASPSRVRIKALLAGLENEHRGIKSNLLRAVGNLTMEDEEDGERPLD
ncbi:tRNA 2-thiocytidine(32) synthetase TtcA [bacterium]|nr:tRNA 2-thiocytidine(32) synthetase TtcA [candidate division CSSED10-310 bacterium]